MSNLFNDDNIKMKYENLNSLGTSKFKEKTSKFKEKRKPV